VEDQARDGGERKDGAQSGPTGMMNSIVLFIGTTRKRTKSREEIGPLWAPREGSRIKMKYLACP
jgi:hypothetical protein